MKNRKGESGLRRKYNLPENVRIREIKDLGFGNVRNITLLFRNGKKTKISAGYLRREWGGNYSLSTEEGELYTLSGKTSFIDST